VSGEVNFSIRRLKFVDMNQLPLFRSQVGEPQRSSDPAYIRKSLNRLVRIARDAEIMPWSDSEAESWEKLFLDRRLTAKHGSSGIDCRV
jgi:hypothetical protein